MGNKKIIFRADAGTDIGYGHFIRSLALADMLKDSFDCLFVTQTPTDYQKKELAKVCAYRELPSDARKFDLFLDMLTGKEIVVLDNYFFDTSYQQAIKSKGCRLICIDDMHDKHYVADVLINHGLTDPNLFSVEPYTRLCLGLEWALLRRPFLESVFCEREPGHVAVAFGGSDSYNLTLRTAEILTRREDIERITAVVGDAYADPARLASLAKVDVMKNLSAEQMADLFRRVAFTVLSSSTVAIEALACGCPVYAGYYIDNQREFYQVLQQNQYIVPIGDLTQKDMEILPVQNLRKPFTDKSLIVSNYLSLLTHLCK